MSAFASAVTLRKWGARREFLPWVVAVVTRHAGILPAHDPLLREPIRALVERAFGAACESHVPTGWGSANDGTGRARLEPASCAIRV